MLLEGSESIKVGLGKTTSGLPGEFVICLLLLISKPDVVAHAFKPSTWEVEADWSL